MTLAVHFRYRKFDSYYADGEVLGTNYWKIANQISGYSGTMYWTIAFLTQFLVTFAGAGVEINLMVWVQGMMVMVAVSIVSEALRFYAYDRSYELSTSGNS